MLSTQSPRKGAKTVNLIPDDFEEAYGRNFHLSSLKLNKLLPVTDNQRSCYYTLNSPSTNLVFIDGVAGSAKSYLAVYSALESLINQQVHKIVYIRSVVESSSRSLGALPGELHEKFSPYTMPLMDKMQEVLQSKSDITMLMSNNIVQAIPVNFVRGLTFKNTFVIVDEAQNLNYGELTTILTRFGEGSRYVICGDSNQSDIKDSGFSGIMNKFDTPHSEKNNIYTYKFDNADVVRSHILKHITQVLGV